MFLYWKEAALFALLGMVFYLGYHLHTLQDKAAENTSLRSQIESLQKANKNIAEFDSNLTNEAVHEKDSCFNQPVPAGIIKLLRNK